MRDKKHFLGVLFLIALVLTAGCQQPLSGQPEQPLPAQTAFPTGAAVFSTQVPDLTSTPPVESNAAVLETECSPLYFSSDTDRLQYRMEMYASLDQHAVSVQETISYPNTSADWLENIRLVVEPNWTPNVFTLSELRLAGETPDNFNLSGGYLDIPLSSPLPPGCAIQIVIKFILMLPYGEGLFGFTDDQFMLTNWYPFIPPYHDGFQWQTNPPGEYGEHLVYPLADFKVRLEFQEKDRTVQVAAPAPAEVEGAVTGYTLTGARTFSLAFLPKHSHLSQTAGDTELHIYYRRANKKTAQAALDTMAKSVTTYEALFGEYPFESLTTAEIEMYDGMEYDGLFFIGRDVFNWYNQSQQNTFSLMLAHETSHNWWFSQVGNDQAIEPWLDEALATYCELLYLEANYPALVDWWWGFRIDYYDPFGPVDVTIYEYYTYEPYRQAVYLRGVNFLQAVRDQVGDEAFFEFLRQYYQNGQFQVADAELFFETLERVTIIDSDPIRRQYFVH